MLESKNIDFYFVYLPEYARYSKNKKNIIFDGKNTKNKILNIIKKLDIKYLDVDKEIFQVQTDPLKLFPFKLNGHYNEQGYKLISAAASVQIDSSINGAAISVIASSTPVVNPFNIVSPSFVADMISLDIVLNGLPIKS